MKRNILENGYETRKQEKKEEKDMLMTLSKNE